MKHSLTLNDMPDVACADCGSVYFKELVRLKKVSALQPPTGQRMVIPVQIMQCNRCGKIDEALLEGFIAQ